MLTLITVDSVMLVEKAKECVMFDLASTTLCAREFSLIESETLELIVVLFIDVRFTERDELIVELRI